MPEKMKDILQDAKGALTKLNNEALKILKKLPQTDDHVFRRIKKAWALPAAPSPSWST